MSALGGYVRAFIAIDVPPAARQIMAGAIRELADQVPGSVRWVDPQGIHVTLKFLGDIPAQDAGDILAALKSPVQQVPAFSLHLTGLGMFPNQRRPRVLWAGVEADAGLTRLHGRIENRLRHLGIDPEGRKFAPHVTLARLKGASLHRLRDYLAFQDGFATEAMPISGFRLYSSTLGAKAAIHNIEADYPLDE